MVSKRIESQELLSPLICSWSTARRYQSACKSLLVSLMQVPGQELPEGRPCAGLGCPQGDAPSELGFQPLAGRQGLEPEQALWDILFTFL